MVDLVELLIDYVPVPDMISHSHCIAVDYYQAQGALSVEEEATALSVWAIACICGSLRLENVS